ncbi:LytR/AlgR family response regulator transcription factor [Xanthocytophaga flava]|uniref:LytR/AlgR family response regulator transcription factor n=1 Tax=Xanthocytophaga flava TaxID=3048013 RepID=UPI0028D2A575|nr:LytTR family DNA-binding domain-containing protein [Xanthocytophaga flavus]MDJ1470243.1 LytTR family DNA-binding domain-containing protein [Xanthocytophaga flavus]
MKCIIVDDEALAVDLLAKYVGLIPDLNLLDSFTDPFKALQYIYNNEVDLIFLDIDMPDIDGFDFMQLVEGKVKLLPFFILTTGQPQYSLDGYEFNVTSYLLKPIPKEKFIKAVQKVAQLKSTYSLPLNKEVGSDYIFVQTENKGKLLRVNFKDINYVEGEKNNISIYTENDRIVLSRNLKDLEDQLPKHLFARINRSYIISIDKISSIENEKVIIQRKDKHIPINIGITFKERFYKQIESAIFTKKIL